MGDVIGMKIKIEKMEYIYLLIVLFVLSLGFVYRNKMISSCIFLLLWILLIVISLKYNKNSNPFDIETSMALRGACAIEIMLGHLGLLTGNIYLFANRKAGILIVGVFFMLSGYGLDLAYNKKKDYLNHFLSRRIPLILLPCIIVVLIDRVINILLFNKKYYSMSAFWGIDEPVWYIYELCVLYILFWLITKWFKDKNWIVLLGLCSCFVCVAYFTNIPSPYYGSTLCFPLGIMANVYYNKLDKRIKTIIVPIVMIVILLSSFVIFFAYGENWFTETIIRNMAAVSFCVIMLCFLQNFVMRGKIISWLGSISLEIFLLHEYVEYALVNIGVYKKVSQYVFILCVIIISIVLAIPLKKINGYIQSKIRKIAKNKI